ncbi:MAG: YceI family protein [Candidatus Omnitrophica bacterium]|nr:YceI family protein [Candidatus Omnitrophota bacterium]
MKIRAMALVLAFGMVFAGPVLAADRYAIDASHSTVGFAVKHLVISTVRGSFGELSGEIMYDEQDISNSSVSVVIKAASIDTNHSDRDTHLKSADFFDVEAFPEITFKSTRVEKTPQGSLCTGILTMRGVSKEITIPFEMTGPVKDPWGNTRIGVEAELTLDRQDYGIKWNKTMDSGGLVVGNTVKIQISVEGIKKPR